MKKVLTVILVGYMCAAPMAQDSITKQERQKPDFSGIWRRDDSRGHPDAEQNPMANLQMTLKIGHRNPKLKITRTMVSKDRRLLNMLPIGMTQLQADFSYFTDGRGESNRSTFGPSSFSASDVKSKTSWEGDKLMVRSSSSRKNSDGSIVRVDIVESWELSSDGKILTNVTTIRGIETSEQVFTKFERP